MPRAKKDPENVVVLNPGAQAPASKDRKGGPTDFDCKAYDRLVRKVERLQAISTNEEWAWLFGAMLEESATAEKALKSCEKMNEVIRCQATIAYVDRIVAKLRQPIEDLNALRTKWPLFTGEMPWKGDFDEPTGRVTLIWAGNGQAPETISPCQFGDACDPGAVPAVKPEDDDTPDEDEDEDEDTTGPDPEPDDPFGDA
jgi:hypothetical protein